MKIAWIYAKFLSIFSFSLFCIFSVKTNALELCIRFLFLFFPIHFLLLFTFLLFSDSIFGIFFLFFSRWFLGLLQIMSFKIEENRKSLHVMLANWDISGIYKSTKCTFYPLHIYVYVCVSLCVYGNCNTLCHHMFV